MKQKKLNVKTKNLIFLTLIIITILSLSWIFVKNTKNETKSKSTKDEKIEGMEFIDSSYKASPCIIVSSPDLPSNTSMPNIIIFGGTGDGKSSLVNMVAGKNIAEVSNSALGCTFGSIGYEMRINNKPFRIWDTAGLNEGEKGNMPAKKAMKNLQDLIHSLKNDGINLIVFCVRGPRFKKVWELNYNLFSQIICQGQVPVVAVITGLENEDPMESWWTNNINELTKHNIVPAGHACVTAIKGKKTKKVNICSKMNLKNQNN